MRKFLYGVVATAALAAASSSSALADVCPIKGMIQAGGGFEATGLDLNTNFAGGLSRGGTTGPLAFAEMGLAYQCGNGWGGQFDAAYYGHWATINSVLGSTEIDLNDHNGHIGTGIYWRDANAGRFGAAASVIINSTGVKVPALGGIQLLNYDSTFFRGGLSGEYYIGDRFTLGAGGYYVGGTSHIGVFGLGGLDLLKHSGFEGNVSAKYYANPHFSLGLRGDLQLDTIDLSQTLFIPLSLPLNGYAVTAEAEYLVPDTSLSLGIGARYAHRELGPLNIGGGANVSLATHDEQAFISLKYSFGGTAPSSLLSRDRSAPVDNTSVFYEKLPSYVFDVTNAALTR